MHSWTLEAMFECVHDVYTSALHTRGFPGAPEVEFGRMTCEKNLPWETGEHRRQVLLEHVKPSVY